MGGRIGGAVGVEIGKDGVLPCRQASSEPGDFRDQAAREAGDNFCGNFPAVLATRVIAPPQLLIAPSGDGHFMAGIACFKILFQAGDWRCHTLEATCWLTGGVAGGA